MEFNRARSSDPITSFQAADQAKELANLHQSKILEVLQQFGPMGKDGIAYMANLNANQVSRRLPEMVKNDMVEPTGKIVKSRSGRSEREWQAIDKH